MNLAILRVKGSDFPLAELKRLLNLTSDTEWHAGDRIKNGGVHESSGFNATIADAETPRAMTELMRSFLVQCREAQVTFPWRGVTVAVEMGFSVGDSAQFIAFTELSPADIRLCGQCGIGLSVTAYPTSDDANATEQPL
jgi:hypothetical protein